jgi:hypothetical protein
MYDAVDLYPIAHARAEKESLHEFPDYDPFSTRFYRGVLRGAALAGKERETMKIFNRKQMPISDCPSSILRVFQNSRLNGAHYEQPRHHRRLFPLGTWLQQLERQKWGIRHRNRMSPVLPKIYAGKQSKLIVREMLRRSGSLRINHDGLVTLRWAWLKNLYSWTLKV